MKNNKGLKEEKILSGIGVSPGIAIGTAFVIDQQGVTVPEYEIAENKVEEEIRRFHATINKTRRQLVQLSHKTSLLPAEAAGDIALLLEAYQGMLSGSRLVRGVEEIIEREKLNAEAAIQRQVNTIVEGFSAMGDVYLAARGNDVREIGGRLIRNLLQQHYNPFVNAPEGSLLVAEEITPADAALMNPERVAGFAAVLGGAEGHAAIMARALSLPAVMGAPGLIEAVNAGDVLIVDGVKGEVIVRPAPATLHRYRQEASRRAREVQKLRETLRNVPGETRDGTSVKLQANIELPREVDKALEISADGVGLFRTEYMFMNRPTLPDEDEQFERLRSLVQRMDGKPVTIRTLDIGGEKLATGLAGVLGESANPALGLRAIRLGLREPKLLETQLAAILRVAAFGPVRILIPMVSSVEQMRQTRAHLVKVESRLRRRGVKLPEGLPPLGAMIEIPGAALAADAFTRVCDFFAIGSNDLTQYTLAIDRGDEHVAALFDPFHPAVLRLIQFVIAAAWRANIPVSLCGELAGDRRATALLVGLGLREFSMAVSNIPFVKQAIRDLTIPQAVAFANEIMNQSDRAAIYDLLARGVGSEKKRKK